MANFQSLRYFSSVADFQSVFIFLAVNLNFLLRYHVYKKQTEDGTKSLAMCTKTLECMEKGGMHDHVGQVGVELHPNLLRISYTSIVYR